MRTSAGVELNRRDPHLWERADSTAVPTLHRSRCTRPAGICAMHIATRMHSGRRGSRTWSDPLLLTRRPPPQRRPPKPCNETLHGGRSAAATLVRSPSSQKPISGLQRSPGRSLRGLSRRGRANEFLRHGGYPEPGVHRLPGPRRPAGAWVPRTRINCDHHPGRHFLSATRNSGARSRRPTRPVRASPHRVGPSRSTR